MGEGTTLVAQTEDAGEQLGAEQFTAVAIINGADGVHVVSPAAPAYRQRKSQISLFSLEFHIRGKAFAAGNCALTSAFPRVVVERGLHGA